MRKYLLATTAAVIALTFSSRVFFRNRPRAIPAELSSRQSAGPGASGTPAKDQTAGPSLVPSGSN